LQEDLGRDRVDALALQLSACATGAQAFFGLPAGQGLSDPMDRQASLGLQFGGEATHTLGGTADGAVEKYGISNNESNHLLFVADVQNVLYGASVTRPRKCGKWEADAVVVVAYGDTDSLFAEVYAEVSHLVWLGCKKASPAVLVSASCRWVQA
jgi:hypothetical protein